MRISFDVQQFAESVNRALTLPCTDNHQKQSMAPVIVPTCMSILQTAEQAEPTSREEAISRVIALLGTAFALGFDSGRIYEDKEKHSRIELIQ